MEEAVEHYESGLRWRPRYPEAHNNLGRALQEMGRPEEAAAHYRHAPHVRRDFPEAHNTLGMAVFGLGRAAKAIEHYRAALASPPPISPRPRATSEARSRRSGGATKRSST